MSLANRTRNLEHAIDTAASLARSERHSQFIWRFKSSLDGVPCPEYEIRDWCDALTDLVGYVSPLNYKFYPGPVRVVKRRRRV